MPPSDCLLKRDISKATAKISTSNNLKGKGCFSRPKWGWAPCREGVALTAKDVKQWI